MKFRINEVNEIKNTEKSSLNKNTQYKYMKADPIKESDKKKLEKPNYTYVSITEVREGPITDKTKGKLR
ncbi:MAG: hypothetical protein MR598_05045 [Erysipelotrichaceae bacterium]|nr:hypothetical protein [Erysipelotrichaceae bacterium]